MKQLISIIAIMAIGIQYINSEDTKKDKVKSKEFVNIEKSSDSENNIIMGRLSNNSRVTCFIKKKTNKAECFYFNPRSERVIKFDEEQSQEYVSRLEAEAEI